MFKKTDTTIEHEHTYPNKKWFEDHAHHETPNIVSQTSINLKDTTDEIISDPQDTDQPPQIHQTHTVEVRKSTRQHKAPFY